MLTSSPKVDQCTPLQLGTYGKGKNEDMYQTMASQHVEWGMSMMCSDNVAVLAGIFGSPMVGRCMFRLRSSSGGVKRGWREARYGHDL